MTNSVTNIVAGRPKSTGGGYSAPLGTALPTDAVAALPGAAESFGYLGDAGLQETIGRTTSPIKAWGGDTVKIVQTDFNVTYDFTLIEALSDAVNKEVYGDDNVVATGATSGHGNQLAIQVTSDPLGHKVYFFEVADGDGAVRVVVPNGQVTAVGAITYSDSTVVAYPVTVTAFPDENGVQAYKYTDDGQATAA